MSARRILRDYGVLIEALKARRIERGLSCADLDARAGFHDGYVNKLENWEKAYGRGIGPVSLRLWLEALGLALVVVATDELPVLASVPTQLPLDLVGGHMNVILERPGYRRGFKRVPTLAA